MRQITFSISRCPGNGTHAMLADDVEKVISQNPGLTAREIAQLMFGIDGYHDRVGNTCHALTETGRVKRRGRGGPGEPFTYHHK